MLIKDVKLGIPVRYDGQIAFIVKYEGEVWRDFGQSYEFLIDLGNETRIVDINHLTKVSYE